MNNNFIQKKLMQHRLQYGPTIAPFNRCYLFIETLMRLDLIKENTAHGAKAILSWRDVKSYERLIAYHSDA